jgi:hypothetical protein
MVRRSHPCGKLSPGPTPRHCAPPEILIAEDARGTGLDGIAPLLDGLKSSDTMLRRVAIRGRGRLQRPALARQFADKLSDPVAAIRAEAANAIAQSVSHANRRNAADPMQADPCSGPLRCWCGACRRA